MSKTVLVYDDEESILEVIKIILEEYGYVVHTSTNGISILSDVLKYRPNLILLDIWMKGINGNEVAAHLKEHSLTKDVPVILVSALNEGKKIAEECGVAGFLKKPFDMDALVKIVQENT